MERIAEELQYLSEEFKDDEVFGFAVRGKIEQWLTRQPESNPTSLDELKVQPIETPKDKVEAVAKWLLDYTKWGDEWEYLHPTTKEGWLKDAREILKLFPEPVLTLVEGNPYTDTIEAEGERGYVTSYHRAFEQGKKHQLAHDQKTIRSEKE